MRRFRWQLALIGVTLLWGATFVVVQDAIEQVPPFRFIAFRFALAAGVMILAGGLRGFRREDLAPGAIAGLALAAGYAFQTIGLRYTSASNAGFITGMFVVFTPLFVAIAARKLPPPASLGGAGLAAIGLYLVASPEGLALGLGDSLELACAASFALHILILDRASDRMPTFRFATLQMLVVAILSGIATFWEEPGVASPDASVWIAIAVTGIGGSAVAFYVQASAQRVLTPTRTAIILTAEPVFAGIFGAIAGDRIGIGGWAGAALILTGILISELRARADRALADPLTSGA